jgi:tRNA dimethylallyltransferase
VTDPLLVLVLGPTGSGKSDLALDIAESFNGEIVNCDSLQLYRGFDIGTAKTPVSERRGIPHHLIDILDPNETFAAGEYSRAARPILRDIAARGHLPVVAGGTGFYVRALLDGLFEGPSRDPDIRARLSSIEARRTGFLHRALRVYDPASAQRIHENDANKLIRALEVCLAARAPMTELFRKGRDPLTGFRYLKFTLNPPREALYYKLNERCRRMLEGGLIEEIQRLFGKGIRPDSKPFESIGYKESLQLVQGSLSSAEALDLMQRNTRRYAKRQLTWFRRESGAVWLDGFGSDDTIRSSAFDMLVKSLQTSSASE